MLNNERKGKWGRYCRYQKRKWNDLYSKQKNGNVKRKREQKKEEYNKYIRNTS